MRTWPAFLLTVIVGASGCGAVDVVSGGETVTICDSPEGAWTNLSTEPEGFRDGSGERIDWTDEAGCAINLNFIFHRFGDDHCNWEAAEVISIGLPLGQPYTGPDAIPPGQDWEPMFFHNTDGAFEHLDPGRILAELPADAVDVGLRAKDERELWAAPDTSELYIRQGDTVRVFVPGSDDATSCA